MDEHGNELHKRPKRGDFSAKMDTGLPYDVRILQSLRQIVRYTELHSRYLATTYKITSPQLVCLLALKEHDSLTTTQLSQQMYVSASTVVGILDRLEEKDFVLRERSRADRRVVDVSLTAKGRRVLENSPSPLQDRLYTGLGALTEQERFTIADSLERVVILMQAQDTEAEPLLESGPLAQSVEGKTLASKVDEIE